MLQLKSVMQTSIRETMNGEWQ